MKKSVFHSPAKTLRPEVETLFVYLYDGGFDYD
jgi:hypothetical protein